MILQHVKIIQNDSCYIPNFLRVNFFFPLLLLLWVDCFDLYDGFEESFVFLDVLSVDFNVFLSYSKTLIKTYAD